MKAEDLKAITKKALEEKRNNTMLYYPKIYNAVLNKIKIEAEKGNYSIRINIPQYILSDIGGQGIRAEVRNIEIDWRLINFKCLDDLESNGFYIKYMAVSDINGVTAQISWK